VVFQRLFRDAAPPQTRNERLGSNRDLVGYTTVQSAAGDLAGLHLSRGDFLAAMDVFFKGGLWLDAAFVADRILTVDELQKYVDEQSVDDQNLRWLLGRRLLREGKLQVAKPYFPRSQLAIFEQYERRLGEGANLKKPARERARALFEAAWIARYFGMELMGTLAEPDGFVSDGQYDTEELDLQRGREVTSGIEPGEFKPVRLHIAATPEEKLRIQKSAPNPDHRFHYRYLAGEIAWEAALLLPNGSEELADVLNCAGYWIRNDEGKKPDRFFFAIEKRCPKSILGKRVIAKRWFLEPDGPWSAPLKKSFPEH
jgi:hypothetical protein